MSFLKNTVLLGLVMVFMINDAGAMSGHDGKGPKQTLIDCNLANLNTMPIFIDRAPTKDFASRDLKFALLELTPERGQAYKVYVKKLTTQYCDPNQKGKKIPVDQLTDVTDFFKVNKNVVAILIRDGAQGRVIPLKKNNTTASIVQVQDIPGFIKTSYTITHQNGSKETNMPHFNCLCGLFTSHYAGFFKTDNYFAKLAKQKGTFTAILGFIPEITDHLILGCDADFDTVDRDAAYLELMDRWEPAHMQTRPQATFASYMQSRITQAYRNLGGTVEYQPETEHPNQNITIDFSQPGERSSLVSDQEVNTLRQAAIQYIREISQK